MKRSRLDLQLSMTEPILVAYHEGAFTLYNEVYCRIELEIELPRHVVKAKNADVVEDYVRAVLERHATWESARNSPAWNERERDPYPEDYERTLTELAVWRANQHNLAVQAKLDAAMDETVRLKERISGNLHYLAGFANGVEEAKLVDFGACSAMMALNLTPTNVPAELQNATFPGVDLQLRGYRDGKTFVFGLELMRRLGDCFVPVPAAPVAVASAD